MATIQLKFMPYMMKTDTHKAYMCSVAASNPITSAKAKRVKLRVPYIAGLTFVIKVILEIAYIYT